ncbi:hypothetical protein GCM10020331_063550 [Ectobacillus funiculus]
MISYNAAIASEILVIMVINQGPLVSGVFFVIISPLSQLQINLLANDLIDRSDFDLNRSHLLSN